MPVVTAIKHQVKRADRYSIYIDGSYSFALGELELLGSGIRLGLTVTDTELEGLRQTAEIDKAYDRALRFLAIRLRSEWELRSYLQRKKLSPTLIEQILNKLSINRYIDDAAFAEAWVRNRRLLKPVSWRRLQAELRAKHIAADVIEAVLAADETDEHLVLRQLVDKKRALPRYRDDRVKLMQYLARQGFSYDMIKQVLQED